jgi:type I restriction enzyme S subunit
MVLVPNNPDLLSWMTGVMQPLFEQYVIQSVESRTLATLRDALLPKLISGEIRVPDEEHLVE